MNHIQRFNAVMNFEKVDRLPMIEWAGYWDKTLSRWYDEGLDVNLKDRQLIRESLGLDPYTQFWIGMRSSDTPQPAKHMGGILNNSDEYKNIKPTLYQIPDFKSNEYNQIKKDNQEGNRVVWLSLDGFFWGPRSLFGVENHLLSFYDQPECVHQINIDLLDFNLRVIDEFCKSVCIPQFMTIAEDMSYNLGPMLSEDHFNEFLKPYYLKLTESLKERGIRILVDSDGDVTQLIPWLKNVGVEGILPLERMAGVDVNEIRKNHPEWLMIGGYNKLVMNTGTENIQSEFERLEFTARSGGFIPSVDHQTPPDVSFSDYKKYLKILNKTSRTMCNRSEVA
jgi:hypothetical protein